jgi:hypothetical protein
LRYWPYRRLHHLPSRTLLFPLRQLIIY